MPIVKRLVAQWVDPFIVALIVVLVFGLLVPLPEGLRDVIGYVSTGMVALLFFLYGARLATREVLGGLTHWRLQGAILVTTFVLYPVLGLALARLVEGWVGPAFALGLAYVALLPSTVQSSVAFVSIARGNVPGAICGATVSNVLGMFLTPLLVMWLLADRIGMLGGAGVSTGVGGAGDAAAVGLSRIGNVFLGLLLPFIIGQLVQPWIGKWVRAHRPLTLAVDRGTILLVVLGAVASATAAGKWDDLHAGEFGALLGATVVLLAVVLAATWWGGKALGLNYADRTALLQCGSTKSLATGLPMAGVLLPAAALSSVVIPIVIYHQLELIVCSVIAKRQEQRAVALERPGKQAQAAA